jgi:tripartite ATP-independent transporter DctM subunit
MTLLIVGSPVVFAIGLAGLSYFIIEPGMWMQVGVYAQRFFLGMDSFVFLCIPLFIFSGEIMKRSGMMADLVRFAQIVVGRFRGGMAYVNVLASMLFGGVTGSGLADVSALGPIEIDAMKKDGYTPAFAAAVTATSAIQGPIIPPSIPMVIFASLTNASIGALFLAGAIPGLLIGLGQMSVIFFLGKKRNFPKHEAHFRIKEIWVATRSAICALLMPIIILGGILGGVFTPTEAAAVAAAYSLIVSIVIYKQIRFKDCYSALLETAKVSASIYLIVGFVSVIGWVLAAERVPSMMLSLVDAHSPAPYLLLFLLNLFFLFNGMWLSDVAQLVLFAPLFTPVLAAMGIHPVHFGTVMVVNIMISMITPPYGLALYLASSIGGVPLKEIVRETLPFTAISIFVLLFVSFLPYVIMFLPRLFNFA